MSKRFRSPVLWLAVSLFAIAGFTSFGPAERSLGANVRVVYLHGAWVWAALASFMAAAGAGLAGLLSGKVSLHHWSRALGRTGLIFWVTYLPISVWAMQTNWNGLFLAEPRWRMALAFAAGGTLLQIGLTLVEKPIWASLGNLALRGGAAARAGYHRTGDAPARAGADLRRLAYPAVLRRPGSADRAGSLAGRPLAASPGTRRYSLTRRIPFPSRSLAAPLTPPGAGLRLHQAGAEHPLPHGVPVPAGLRARPGGGPGDAFAGFHRPLRTGRIRTLAGFGGGQPRA